MTKNSDSHTRYLRDHTSSDCNLWYTSVKDNISWRFFIFSKFWFLGLLGGSKGKKWPKMTKNFVLCTLYFRNHTSYDLDLLYTNVKGQYPLLHSDVFWYHWNSMGAQKNVPKNVLVTLFPYVFHVKTKWNIVYQYLKIIIFSRDINIIPQMHWTSNIFGHSATTIGVFCISLNCPILNLILNGMPKKCLDAALISPGVFYIFSKF